MDFLCSIYFLFGTVIVKEMQNSIIVVLCHVGVVIMGFVTLKDKKIYMYKQTKIIIIIIQLQI